MKKRSKYSLAADSVVFGVLDHALHVLLIQRKNTPFQGMWALPGGFIEGDETVEDGAYRELLEETGVKKVYLEQFHVFSKPDRDPRGRVISIAFFALINPKNVQLTATQDASHAAWWPVKELPALAFDHERIFQKGFESLKEACEKKPIVSYLLPKEFRLFELQTLYEEIFNTKLDKRNFRKKVAAMPFIQPTGKMSQGGRHRPAELFKFQLGGYL